MMKEGKRETETLRMICFRTYASGSERPRIGKVEKEKQEIGRSEGVDLRGKTITWEVTQRRQ